MQSLPRPPYVSIVHCRWRSGASARRTSSSRKRRRALCGWHAAYRKAQALTLFVAPQTEPTKLVALGADASMVLDKRLRPGVPGEEWCDAPTEAKRPHSAAPALWPVAQGVVDWRALKLVVVDYKEKSQPRTRAMREEQGSYWDNSSN